MENALITGDGKIEFWFSLANWLESWKSASQSLCLSKPTCDALIRTLGAQERLCLNLFEEGYSFIITSKFQSDPLERRFSQYRQMSEGDFLVSLREVVSSENTLLYRSLLKGRINFWQEDLMKEGPKPDRFIEALVCEDCDVDSLTLSPESTEVGYTVAGSIANKIKRGFLAQHAIPT